MENIFLKKIKNTFTKLYFISPFKLLLTFLPHTQSSITLSTNLPTLSAQQLRKSHPNAKFMLLNQNIIFSTIVDISTDFPYIFVINPYFDSFENEFFNQLCVSIKCTIICIFNNENDYIEIENKLFYISEYCLKEI
ncbi:hypothetical protein CWI37_0709p0030 [Hamiltosporidium tvaerminnensis]|uniref:Uncharacterized protein n=2 Tax=Hamiltosporidium TaxID=1176354 RepID=A0A4Q9KSL0_9MICR|nr:hypothetical protein CWI39_3298p0010 [Hamiltosporidium magnivora]TBU01442.1 hypothetical protein CWI37_0709p0030 [Hamiltosporidium tvaerminnensis]TBU03947.1 hypothetical protein CWI36_0836p0040 [Hamiltosporidium magnivora]